MKDLVRHQGRVIRLEKAAVWVAIDSASACSGCHAKGACGGLDCSQKEICVPTNQKFNIGDSVTVGISTKLGFAALILGYILPFLLLIGGIIIPSLFNVEEGLCALIGLSAVVIYYLALIPFKAFFGKKIHFTISSSSH